MKALAIDMGGSRPSAPPSATAASRLRSAFRAPRPAPLPGCCRGTGVYWLLAAVMALFRFGSAVTHGVASNSLGTAVAWPAFMSLIVITAMMWGVATGE